MADGQRHVLITATENPDLDGVSCAIAYQAYLADHGTGALYEAAFEGDLQIEPAFVIRKLGLKAARIVADAQYESFILVDACEPLGLPAHVRNEDVIEVIDHRQFPDYAAFPNAKFRVEPVGAAATQIAEEFYFDQDSHDLLTPKLAALLLCGIYSNTVNFKSDTTTFRDTRMRDWLSKLLPADLKGLPRQMFKHKTQAILDNLAEALKADVHDDCRQFGEGITAAIYQLELLGSEPLKARLDEVYEHMKRLYPENPYQMLIVQDIEEGRTTVFSQNDWMLRRLAGTSLPGKVVDDRFELDRVIMRKSIKKALLESAK